MRLVMRLYFAVSTYINLYLRDPKTKEDLVGCRLTERSMSQRKTHLLTIDKTVCEMPLSEAYNHN